jgi:hypothetical protein
LNTYHSVSRWRGGCRVGGRVLVVAVSRPDRIGRCSADRLGRVGRLGGCAISIRSRDLAASAWSTLCRSSIARIVGLDCAMKEGEVGGGGVRGVVRGLGERGVSIMRREGEARGDVREGGEQGVRVVVVGAPESHCALRDEARWNAETETEE